MSAYMLVVTTEPIYSESNPRAHPEYHQATVKVHPWNELTTVVVHFDATSRDEKRAVSYALTEAALAFSRGDIKP